MRVIKRKYNRLPLSTRRQLFSLTLGSLSGMREVIRGNDNTSVLIAIEGDVVLGWLLLEEGTYKYRGNKVWRDAMVYVRKTNRRQGVGTKLILSALKAGSCHVFPWNDVSKSFFISFSKRKLVKKYNRKLTLREKT